MSHSTLLKQSLHLRSSLVTAVAIAVSAGCQMASDGHNLDGVRLYQRGQYNAALQQFQEALAKNPANADAYYNLARTTHQMGIQANDNDALKQAETLYNQCLDIDENHVDCRRGLGVLLVQTDRADRALKLMTNWAMAHPEVADARIELARLYEELGDPETAKIHLNDALELDHMNHRAWAALGRLREQLGEYDQALANYQRSLQLNQFQQGVAERVADLSRAMSSDFRVTPAGSTRTVSNPGVRY